MGDKIINFKQYWEDKGMTGNTARKMDYQYDKNVINVMTFEEWCDINEAVERHNRKKNKVARKIRANYYHRQRMFGGLIMSFGLIAGIVGCFTKIPAVELIGVCMAFAGLYTIFTRNMIFVDEYFLEQQDKLYR